MYKGTGFIHVTANNCIALGLAAAVLCHTPSTCSCGNMPPERFLTSAGWSLNGLISKGPRFREIPRVSVSDNNLEMTIRHHESSGTPLVIEGMCEQHAWPTTMFDIQWLRDNSKQRELSGLVRWLGRGDILDRDTGQERAQPP